MIRFSAGGQHGERAGCQPHEHDRSADALRLLDEDELQLEGARFYYVRVIEARPKLA